MANKEATARIKINKLLEAAGWRLFPDTKGPANVCLELNVKLKEKELNALTGEGTGSGTVILSLQEREYK